MPRSDHPPAGPAPSTAPAPSWVALPEDGAWRTLLDFLEERFPRIPRSVWHHRMEAGKVLDEDGRRLGPAAPYRPRTRVQYFREVAQEPRVPFPIRVLYRNENLLVADKPHFLPVVPAGPYVNECLVYRLRRLTGEHELTPVHRLDRATAGLVICSLRKETRGALTRLFAERKVEKEYLAVADVPEPPEPGGRQTSKPRRWRLASRLVRGQPPFRIREVEGEPNAVTRLELVAWARDRDGRGRGLFRVWPETGKKHQIRHHLASLGWPIVHERYYPRLLPEEPVDFDRPLQLLARRLELDDPVTGEHRIFVSRRSLAEVPRALDSCNLTGPGTYPMEAAPGGAAHKGGGGPEARGQGPGWNNRRAEP